MTKQQLNKEWEPHPVLLEEIQKTQPVERPNMLSRILAAIGIRRPKNPPPITAEEWEVFNRAKELIENAEIEVLSKITCFSVQEGKREWNFDIDYHHKYAWPALFIHMDYKRPELGGALYELVRQKVEKRQSEYREARRAEFLGREDGGGNSSPRPKPEPPLNEFRPI